MDATSVSQDQARPEDQPKPQEPIPAHRGIGTWSFWLLIARAIYVLSIGPVAKLDQALHISEKTPGLDHVLQIIYSPVIASAASSRPTSSALQWYLFTLWKVGE